MCLLSWIIQLVTSSCKTQNKLSKLQPWHRQMQWRGRGEEGERGREGEGEGEGER